VAAIVVDIDGTLISESGVPNDKLIEILNRKKSEGDEIIVVSARNVSGIESTRNELDDAGLDYSSIHLNDFPGPAIATGVAFKEYKVKRLQREGKKIEDGIDNSSAVRRVYDGLGLHAWSPSEYVAANGPRRGIGGQEIGEVMMDNTAEMDAVRSVEVEMGIEFRTARVELRAVDGTGMEFEGYAALYDSPSADGTTPEVVKDTAFNRSIAAVDRGEWDVRAYQDHDPKLLLGTTKSGTLSLKSDGKGLLAKIKLNPEISFHRDLAAIVKSMGSSLGMSFGFWNTNANRVNDNGIRELRDVKLVEVSALTGLAPYYPGTISLVSVRGLAQKAGVDSSELRDAIAALLAGESTADHASILASAIAASSRDVEGVPINFPGDDKKDDKKNPKTDKVEEEKVPVDEEKRSIVEDLGIMVEDLIAAVDALVAGNASQEQIDLIAQVAKAEIADAQDSAPSDMVPTDTAPSDVMPPEEVPIETHDPGNMDAEPIKVEIEITVPRSVPRTLREKELDLRRHAVK
jgi:HK97 family phage prohead protease